MTALNFFLRQRDDAHSSGQRGSDYSRPYQDLELFALDDGRTVVLLRNAGVNPKPDRVRGCDLSLHLDRATGPDRRVGEGQTERTDLAAVCKHSDTAQSGPVGVLHKACSRGLVAHLLAVLKAVLLAVLRQGFRRIRRNKEETKNIKAPSSCWRFRH